MGAALRAVACPRGLWPCSIEPRRLVDVNAGDRAGGRLNRIDAGHAEEDA